MTRIPMEEYVAYTNHQRGGELLVHRQGQNDFPSLQPCLEKLIDFNRRFAAYKDLPSPLTT